MKLKEIGSAIILIGIPVMFVLTLAYVLAG